MAQSIHTNFRRILWCYGILLNFVWIDWARWRIRKGNGEEVWANLWEKPLRRDQDLSHSDYYTGDREKMQQLGTTVRGWPTSRTRMWQPKPLRLISFKQPQMALISVTSTITRELAALYNMAVLSHNTPQWVGMLSTYASFTHQS